MQLDSEIVIKLIEACARYNSCGNIEVIDKIDWIYSEIWQVYTLSTVWGMFESKLGFA